MASKLEGGELEAFQEGVDMSSCDGIEVGRCERKEEAEDEAGNPGMRAGIST